MGWVGDGKRRGWARGQWKGGEEPGDSGKEGVEPGDSRKEGKGPEGSGREDSD